MQLFDVWTIITGLASIVSLLLAVSHKIPKWKLYIVPVGAGFAGFSLGRLSTIKTPAIANAFSDPILFGLFCVLLIVTISAVYVLKLLLKGGHDIFAGIVIASFFGFGYTQIITQYNAFNPQVSSEDYIQFANCMEQKGDYGGAIKYLQLYHDNCKSDDVDTKKLVKNKIFKLKEKSFSISLPKSK